MISLGELGLKLFLFEYFEKSKMLLIYPAGILIVSSPFFMFYANIGDSLMMASMFWYYLMVESESFGYLKS
jgi:hypothetical protein